MVSSFDQGTLISKTSGSSAGNESTSKEAPLSGAEVVVMMDSFWSARGGRNSRPSSEQATAVAATRAGRTIQRAEVATVDRLMDSYDNHRNGSPGFDTTCRADDHGH
jgi:hypothetical protein